jgi:hypothetical protein
MLENQSWVMFAFYIPSQNMERIEHTALTNTLAWELSVDQEHLFSIVSNIAAIKCYWGRFKPFKRFESAVVLRQTQYSARHCWLYCQVFGRHLWFFCPDSHWLRLSMSILNLWVLVGWSVGNLWVLWLTDLSTCQTQVITDLSQPISSNRYLWQVLVELASHQSWY